MSYVMHMAPSPLDTVNKLTEAINKGDVLFAPSITEEVSVVIKNDEDSTCVVEGSDRVPRTISNCPYNSGDTVSITYKPQQPSIERHELRQTAASRNA
jgi:hypothetical protein